jgi:5-methylcytosine-specific restriction protein A
MKTSEKLSIGQVYTRAELADMFGLGATTGGNLHTWIFRPDKQRFNSYWMFVTAKKTSDRPQVVDRLEDDILHTEGQAKQMTDSWIKNHIADGIEVVVFFRNKKNEYAGGGFRYEGVFEYRDHEEGSKPTKFRLVRVNDLDSLEEVAARDIEAEDLERGYREGAKRQTLTNKYERDPRARAAAVQLHGVRCIACGFLFSEFYGGHGDGYIQVHHLKSIASYGEVVEIDPAKDLTVVCSNCHSMIHRRPNEPLSIADLRAMIANAKAGSPKI